MSDPLSALLVELADGAERSEAVRCFRATLPPSVRVHSVARVQNLPMWQSYVVKRHTPPHGWVDFMKALPLHNQGRPRSQPPLRWGRPVAQPTDTRAQSTESMKHERRLIVLPRGGAGRRLGRARSGWDWPPPQGRWGSMEPNPHGIPTPRTLRCSNPQRGNGAKFG